jgi:hypothetical protein
MRLNYPTSDTLPFLHAKAQEVGEYWAVVRHGHRTRKIIGRYNTCEEAIARLLKYRGKANAYYVCGSDAGLLPITR